MYIYVVIYFIVQTVPIDPITWPIWKIEQSLNKSNMSMKSSALNAARTIKISSSNDMNIIFMGKVSLNFELRIKSSID